MDQATPGGPEPVEAREERLGTKPVPHLSRERPGNDGNYRELLGSQSPCSEALSRPFPQVGRFRVNGLESR